MTAWQLAEWICGALFGGMVWEVWRERRRNREWEAHTQRALTMVRHPSTQVPVEDSPEWAARWGL